MLFLCFNFNTFAVTFSILKLSNDNLRTICRQCTDQWLMNYHYKLTIAKCHFLNIFTVIIELSLTNNRDYHMLYFDNDDE